NGLIMYATLALLAPYLQTLMNYPVVTTGIVLAPRGVGIMLAAMICGRLLKIASSLFSVGRNIHLLLHRTTVPTWSVFLGSADRGGFFVPA
ncbi:MAG: EmrB/QacA family drug resistance transporter, partial [Xanthobacteraceae bacterium]